MEIIALLRDQGEQWANWLESQSEEFLAERVKYPAGMTPPTKTRFEMLLGIKEHEMHHRGPLMLIERMLIDEWKEERAEARRLRESGAEECTGLHSPSKSPLAQWFAS